MEIYSLSSGSKGNSTYININGKHMLIDVGISRKQINQRLLINVGIDLDDISTILITHEHSDHIQAIPVISKNYPHIKFIIPKKAYDGILERLKYAIPQSNLILIEKNIKGNSIDIKTIPLNHDVPCVAYHIIDNVNEESYMHIADNGGIPYNKWDDFKGATYYSIESNHDLTMQIMDTKRDAQLKRRVLGFYGHTDNVSAIKFAIHIVGSYTKGVIFNHLSEDCNSVELAMETHDEWLTIFGERTKFKDIKLVYATQKDVKRLV